MVKKLSIFGAFTFDEDELLEMPNSMSNDASGACLSNPSIGIQVSRVSDLISVAELIVSVIAIVAAGSIVTTILLLLCSLWTKSLVLLKLEVLQHAAG